MIAGCGVGIFFAVQRDDYKVVYMVFFFTVFITYSNFSVSFILRYIEGQENLKNPKKESVVELLDDSEEEMINEIEKEV